jgi:hypothetical protein
MRALAEPKVLKSSAIAAALTSIACYPRLLLTPQLPHPVWYLESLLFLGGIVLWAFVFAWYPNYMQRPLFTVRVGWATWVMASVAGVGGGLLLHFLLDPALRARTPSEFPVTVRHWLAMALFNLSFTPLLLIFAPFSWLLRLIQRKAAAIALTVLFGLFVLAVKNRGGSPMPSGLFAGLVIFRVAAGLLSTYLFLRGGVVLVWWFTLLLQGRNLLEFCGRE